MVTIGKWLALINLLTAYAWAGSVTGSLNSRQGTTEDTFQYTLRIQGQLNKEPEFPNISGLRVLQRSQSSSMSIINGRRSSDLRLIYILKAERSGNFDIPSINVMVDGKTEKTSSQTLTVRELSLKERRSRPLYVEQSLSKTEFYQGESVLLSVRLFSRYQVAQMPEFAVQPPSGIRSTPLGEVKSEVRTIEGNQYQVAERNFLIVADQPNITELPGSIAVAYLATGQRSFFSSGVQKQQITSNPLSIRVKQLPSQGRSKNFSGLVGEFDMNIEFLKRSVNQGDNVGFSIVLFGNGESKTMSQPMLNLNDPQKMKVYRDKPIENLNLKSDGTIASEKVLTYRWSHSKKVNLI